MQLSESLHQQAAGGQRQIQPSDEPLSTDPACRGGIGTSNAFRDIHKLFLKGSNLNK